MHGFGITDPTFLQLGPRKKTAKLGQAEQSFRANSTTEARLADFGIEEFRCTSPGSRLLHSGTGGTSGTVGPSSSTMAGNR